MDRLIFVFSLLLIVSVTTTFGSVIKAKLPTKEKIEALQSDAGLHHYPEMFPNRQRLESLLKRSHEPKSLRYQDWKKEKKDYIEKVFFTDDFDEKELSNVLDDLTGEGPNLAYGIENQSGENWDISRLHRLCSNDPKETQRLFYQQVLVLGISGSPEQGLVEVITNFITGINKTLAVMWFLRPAELTIGNLWNIGLYEGDTRPNNAMLLEMFHSDPFAAGKEVKHETLDHSNLKFDGLMSTTGEATLKIKVYK